MPSSPSKVAGDLFTRLTKTAALESFQNKLEGGGGRLSCRGVSRASQALVCVLLTRLFPDRPVLVVTEGSKAQEQFHQDIETWLELEATEGVAAARPKSTKGKAKSVSGTGLQFYPAWETLPHESRLPHADVISERLETLIALSAWRGGNSRKSMLIVTQVAGMVQRTFRPEMIGERTRVLRAGDSIDPRDLIDWLESQGYEPEAQVTRKGEIALRGGIVDVHPPTSPWPVRLEFFGNELESLRYFDPLTQISREPVDTVTLPPAGELGILKRMIQELPTESKEERDQPQACMATLLDHLPSECLVVLCEPELLAEHADAYEQQVPEEDPFFQGWSETLEGAHRRRLSVLALSEDPGEADLTAQGGPDGEGRSLTLGFSNLEMFHQAGERRTEALVMEAQRREFFNQLHRWLRQGYQMHLFCNNTGERDRFCEIWADFGFGTLDPGKETPGRRNLQSAQATPILSLGALSAGFLCEAAKVVVVTDAEVFGRYKVQRPRRLKSAHAVAARSMLDIDFAEMEEGDFVVHLQHGIGRYRGLKTLPAGPKRPGDTNPSGTGQECMVIEYAASDPAQEGPKLYVPVTESHLVSKYVGAGKARPMLNTLGGQRWAKTKAQAEEAVKDVAGELLAIQAARESRPGHAFEPDTPWQREFESAFLYEETADQLRSINEAKRDMESPRPMDRLVCGDVGYGKTEVAIRAAFKAVMGGRQVALLVPTTILAQQHYNTFRERMADYPVRVEQLSRFITRKAQNQVVQQLAEGSVDIVIGTHRLLQADIAFKELGLVVIDEEQRFGVLHKERLKKLRTMVDVLTLSATPIPRTLYLALTGARDMSTIETPPQDRLPVETIVAQYDERLLRDAIQRELNRDGQVYYLHNRVMTIERVADRVRALVPGARVIVGHGQMGGDALEEIMAKFINGEADVLVSTTIIESGIDIPNANTIIIDRADRFGLSDLYQLRGRVGRYKHQAYAYLLLPRHASLLTDVRKRITAIRQYSSLGSGFKIAMRDLEIRGAGNMLGSQQSGHITAVGFDLYCQLLKQSISAAKGEKVKPRIDTVLRLDFIALNPAEEIAPPSASPPRGKGRRPRDTISVPRETATYLSEPEDPDADERESGSAAPRAAAYVPFEYISEPQHRIEVYRKLAQAQEKAALEQIRSELVDRFGRMPEAIERLLQITELKILGSERGVVAIETKGDKLMLTRNNDFITLGGKFPRLTKRDARGRIQEIKKLLLAL
jgi:transcription-repair coupling factor (superfamily II helicase)